MRSTLPIAAALAMAGCTTLTGPARGPTAGIGETAAIGALRVRPIEVVEDSRCPANAKCVWAGRFVLRAEVSRPRFRQVRTLTLGEAQEVAGGKLTLVSVAPEKLAGPQPPSSPPRFTFSVD